MMMTSIQASYEPFVADQDDSEETPQEFGAMIHIVPESGKGEYLIWVIVCVKPSVLT